MSTGTCKTSPPANTKNLVVTTCTSTVPMKPPIQQPAELPAAYSMSTATEKPSEPPTELQPGTTCTAPMEQSPGPALNKSAAEPHGFEQTSQSRTALSRALSGQVSSTFRAEHLQRLLAAKRVKKARARAPISSFKICSDLGSAQPQQRSSASLTAAIPAASVTTSATILSTSKRESDEAAVRPPVSSTPRGTKKEGESTTTSDKFHDLSVKETPESKSSSLDSSSERRREQAYADFTKSYSDTSSSTSVSKNATDSDWDSGSTKNPNYNDLDMGSTTDPSDNDLDMGSTSDPSDSDSDTTSDPSDSDSDSSDSDPLLVSFDHLQKVGESTTTSDKFHDPMVSMIMKETPESTISSPHSSFDRREQLQQAFADLTDSSTSVSTNATDSDWYSGSTMDPNDDDLDMGSTTHPSDNDLDMGSTSDPSESDSDTTSDPSDSDSDTNSRAAGWLFA